MSMKKIPLPAVIILVMAAVLIGFYAWFAAIHTGQSGDPAWENYTETYPSIAEAEAVLGEDLLLNRLIDSSDEPYKGWHQYIEAQYGTDMLEKLEKEW